MNKFFSKIIQILIIVGILSCIGSVSYVGYTFCTKQIYFSDVYSDLCVSIQKVIENQAQTSSCTYPITKEPDNPENSSHYYEEEVFINEQIEHLSRLQQLEEDTMSMDLLVFLYGFLSSVFVGVGAYFVKNIKEESDKMQKMYGDANNDLNNATNKLTSAESKLSSADTKLTNAENKLSSADTKLTNAENKLSSADTKLQDAENKLSIADTKLKDAENKLSFADIKLKDTENKLISTDAKLINAESKLSLADARLVEAQNKLISAENRFSSAQEDIIEVKETLNNHKHIFEKSKVSLENNILECSNKQEEIYKFHKNILQLNNKIPYYDALQTANLALTICFQCEKLDYKNNAEKSFLANILPRFNDTIKFLISSTKKIKDEDISLSDSDVLEFILKEIQKSIERCGENNKIYFTPKYIKKINCEIGNCIDIIKRT